MKNQLNFNRWQNLLKKNFQQNLNRGFSLSELLIVILITGIIPAAIASYLVSHYQLHEQQISLGK